MKKETTTSAAIGTAANNSAFNSIIKVIGVGGGGSNAVNNMFRQGIIGVDFAICNTDNQALDASPVPVKIQLGPDLTEGRGAGAKPEIGREACVESIDEVRRFLSNNTKMLFITAGMGGGTGTGAAPVIAKVAQELDILTVGIITVPFTFEGRRRSSQATEGLDELKRNVDTLIVISNDKLREIHGNLGLQQAFAEADNILTIAAKGIAEIITVTGYVNVDFEDVNTVMRGSGAAIMGTGVAEGKERARRAAEAALRSPLLEDTKIRGAKNILLNITSGKNEVTMDEVFEITEFIQEEAGHGTDLIWGNCFDDTLTDEVIVTVIATGFEAQAMPQQHTYGTTTSTKTNAPAPQQTPNATLLNTFNEAPAPRVEKHAPTPPPRRVIMLDDDEQNYARNQRGQRNDSTNSTNEPQRLPITSLTENYEEPFVKATPPPPSKEDRRRERLQQISVKLNNPESINEMENQPAYARRNVRLEDVSPSSRQNLSRWSITDDEDGGKPELRENNSFLHDNVD